MEGFPVLLRSEHLFNYCEFDPDRLTAYLSVLPELATMLGGRRSSWQVEQIEDNDMNLVFIVTGPSDRLCVKQAVPVVTLGGEAIKVPLERMVYEEAALALYRRIAPEFAPRVLHYDSQQYLLVLEWLGNHRPLRRCLMDGRSFEHAPPAIGRFLASTAFATSDFAMPAREKRERQAFFCGNSEMRDLGERLAFNEPFASTGTSAWLSPDLDLDGRTLRADPDLKRAVAELHLKVLTEPQALMHGDLHSGSIMVSETGIKVIDAEFAGFGPIGCDIGGLMGDLLIAYFSQPGHAGAEGARDDVEDWLLAAIQAVWQSFHDSFLRSLREAPVGDALPAVLFEGPGAHEARRAFEQDYMRRLFVDAPRFAGHAMVRRVLGRRPAPELASIGERTKRAAAERKTLLLGRELIKDAHYVLDLDEVAHIARQIQSGKVTHA